MPPVKCTTYLLVFIDTTGWIKAFPTTNKRASIVAIILFREIIPCFGLPTLLQSDNGPEFSSTIVQQLNSYIGSKWLFHILYHAQSSGKVEKANTLKKHTELTHELQMDWNKLLPLALFHIQALPTKASANYPFEAMYGHPPCTTGSPYNTL
jgi:hypothetical protein